MRYYDIHTHQPTEYPGDIAVVSVDVRRESVRKGIFFNRRLPDDRKSADDLIQPSNYYSIGVHPWHVDAKSMEYVYEYASLPAIVAIGETGLDKLSAKDEYGFRLQQELFSAHAALSEEVQKPLIIHCVKAWEELLYIRKTIQPAIPWIIHGFRGKDPLASQLINAGLYLSFGKYYHKEALKVAWQKERLLTETETENADIRNIYKQIANDLDISKEDLSEEIARFFKTRILISR
jgi:TatD DNase family protein